jgi:hypothetical protein
MDCVRDKRVIILGPAGYVYHEMPNYKELVQGYDIVVTFNGDMSLNFDVKYHILISHFYNSTMEKYDDRNNWLKIHKKNHPDMLYLPRCIHTRSDHHLNRIKGIVKGIVNHNKIKIAPTTREKEIIDKFKLSQTMFDRFTTGTFGILEILYNKPKELFICGMTLRLDKKYNNWKDNYYTIVLPKYAQKNYTGENEYHDFKIEAKFIYNIIKSHDNVICDKYMLKILKDNA